MRRLLFPAAVLTFGLMCLVGLSAQQALPADGRMAFMHRNAPRTLSQINPLASQSIPSTQLPATMRFGTAWPSGGVATYLLGIAVEPPALIRVNADGTSPALLDLSSTFTAITAATPVYRDGGAWAPEAFHSGPEVCTGWDLKTHYVVVGTLATGGSGLMLIDPATQTAYAVGASTNFRTSSTSVNVTDVCFNVYPGADGQYGTTADNEYRYVLAHATPGVNQGGLKILSLTGAQTADGGTRGPAYPLANDVMEANAGAVGDTFFAAESQQPIFCRSYYLRGNIAACSAVAGRGYAIESHVLQTSINPARWSVMVSSYELGTSTFTALRSTGSILYRDWPSSAIPHAMAIVGDWAIVTIGSGAAGFGDQIAAIYIPELIDGPADDGQRGAWLVPGISAGSAGFFPSLYGRAAYTCFGTGPESTSAYMNTSTPYQDWATGIQNAGGGMVAVDCGAAAPQPLLGFYRAVGGGSPPPSPPPPTAPPPPPGQVGGQVSSTPAQSGCSAGVQGSAWGVFFLVGLAAWSISPRR